MAGKIDFDSITRDFLLNEQKTSPDSFSYIQAIREMLDRMNPHTLRESRSIALIKEHLREISRGVKRMMDENKQLQERLTILEEDKSKQ